jgi:hypothetical protein
VLYRYAQVELCAFELEFAVAEAADIQEVINQYGLMARLPLDPFTALCMRWSAVSRQF